MVRSHLGAQFFMQKRIRQLIEVAEKRMLQSGDAYHDMSHARRVAENAEQISRTFDLNQKERDALILAAWWHDTGRTVIKKPSIIWMRLVDDMISAFLLWKESLKVKEFSTTISLAIRIIMCSNIGTGKIFVHLLLHKKHRILLSILKDSDTLDTLCIERLNFLYAFAHESKINQYKYKIAIWWFLHSKELHFRTEKAKLFFEKSMQEFLVWVNDMNTFEWHKQTFGLQWIEQSIEEGEKILKRVQKQLAEISDKLTHSLS